jgi:hypothetical protein
MSVPKLTGFGHVVRDWGAGDWQQSFVRELARVVLQEINIVPKISSTTRTNFSRNVKLHDKRSNCYGSTFTTNDQEGPYRKKHAYKYWEAISRI